MQTCDSLSFFRFGVNDRLDQPFLSRSCRPESRGLEMRVSLLAAQTSKQQATASPDSRPIQNITLRAEDCHSMELPGTNTRGPPDHVCVSMIKRMQGECLRLEVHGLGVIFFPASRCSTWAITTVNFPISLEVTTPYRRKLIIVTLLHTWKKSKCKSAGHDTLR